MNRIVSVGLFLALALAFAGCPRRGGDDNVNENVTANDNGNANDNSAANENANLNASENDNGGGDDPLEATAGTWQRVSGELFTENSSFEITYVVFNADATAQLYFRHSEIHLANCYRGIYAAAPAALILTVDDMGEGDVSVVLTRQQPDLDTLELGDVVGRVAVFARVEVVPDEFLCRELTILNTYEELPRPGSWTGLAYDDTEFLWYTTDDGEQQAVSPAGTIGPALDLSCEHVHAYQGNGDSGLWLFSSSGSMEEAQRRDFLDALLDTINTSDLGAPIGINALAYHAGDGVLWLHGLSHDAEGGERLLRVINHHEPDPDELLGTHAFETTVQALSWHGTSLWAIISSGKGAVAEIDPTTFEAIRAYSLPLHDVEWQGLAWVGDSLYLIGEDGGDGVLIQTEPAP